MCIGKDAEERGQPCTLGAGEAVAEAAPLGFAGAIAPHSQALLGTGIEDNGLGVEGAGACAGGRRALQRPA